MNDRPLYYVLDEHKQPVPADADQWSIMFSDVEGRRVAREDMGGGVTVSTVFLGMDHGFDENGPPILFETLVFNGPGDGDMVRYATWAQAESGHADMVSRVRQALAAATVSSSEQAQGLAPGEASPGRSADPEGDANG